MRQWNICDKVMLTRLSLNGILMQIPTPSSLVELPLCTEEGSGHQLLFLLFARAALKNDIYIHLSMHVYKVLLLHVLVTYIALKHGQ